MKTKITLVILLIGSVAVNILTIQQLKTTSQAHDEFENQLLSLAGRHEIRLADLNQRVTSMEQSGKTNQLGTVSTR